MACRQQLAVKLLLFGGTWAALLSPEATDGRSLAFFMLVGAWMLLFSWGTLTDVDGMWQRHKESRERRAAAWSSERRDDEPTTPLSAQWRLNETLACLLHLELIELLREYYGFSIGGAAFPETHIHATSPEEDLQFLKAKVDAGAQFLITQMLFDNRYYFDFVARARAIGIDVPIVPGVMPILSRSGIRRMAELSKARLPDGLQRALEVREDEEAIAEFGVSYATLQCAELLGGGAPGIHFITLNRSPATRAILAALKLMRPWDAKRTALEEASLALG